MVAEARLLVCIVAKGLILGLSASTKGRSVAKASLLRIGALNLELPGRVQGTVIGHVDRVDRGRLFSQWLPVFFIGQGTGRTAFDDLHDLLLVSTQIWLTPRLASSDEELTVGSSALSYMNAQGAIPGDVSLLSLIANDFLV
jgi:hypothetical protein